MKSSIQIIIGLNVLIYFLQWVIPGFTQAFILIPEFAFSEPWRLVSSMFLHSTETIFHIILNMMVLFFFGPLLERMLGVKKFILFYLVGGISGSILYSLLSSGASLGASGAIIAILGALVFTYPRIEILLFFFIPMKLWQLVIFLGVFDLIGLFKPMLSIGHAAHLGGLVFGLVYGYFLRQKKTKFQQKFQKSSMLSQNDLDEYMRSGRI